METYAVIVDKVSTINRFGGFWAPKGNSGNNAKMVVDTGGDAAFYRTPISMYRKINLRVDEDRYKYKDDKDSGKT